MQEIISRTGEDRCLSCGLALEGGSRFCPSCGTRTLPQPPQPRAGPQRGVVDSFAAAAPPSSRQGKPWGLVGPLIATGLAIILLAGWLVSVNGRLSETKRALSREQSRVTKLNGQVTSLDSQVKDLTGEKKDLQNSNSSLESAMIDCKDAADKTRSFLKMAVRAYQGTASAADVKSAARAAQSSWSVCRTEAATNGSL